MEKHTDISSQMVYLFWISCGFYFINTQSFLGDDNKTGLLSINISDLQLVFLLNLEDVITNLLYIL